MKIPSVFLDHKKRNLILWLTDMTVAIVSYFYITSPKYIKKTIAGLDLATLRPDMDPEFFQTPEFFALMQRSIMVVVILTVGLIAIFHTLAFYRCYQRQKIAIAYVKIYSFSAAFSLLLYLIYNFHFRSFWSLGPMTIYTLVFMVEKQIASAPTVKKQHP